MKRALRIRFAVLAAFAISFAQIVVAAQPWPAAMVPHSHAPASLVAPAADLPSHCAHVAGTGEGAPMPDPGAPAPNACEVRCQDAAQPDALIVAIAAPVPQSWLALPLAEPLIERARTITALDASSASPPVRLLFSRLLD